MSKTTARRRRSASKKASLWRPTIQAGNQHLPTVSADAWEALKSNNDPPYMFVYGDVPVRLVPTAARGRVPQVFTLDTLRYELARAANWQKGDKPAMPSKEVVRDMLAFPSPPLPPLTRFTSAPIYVPGPKLLNVPGYDPKSQTYYHQPTCLESLRIPKAPTGVAKEQARRFLLEELLVDFPFVADSDRAHALSLLLLPFVRPLIDGLTPLHLVEKPTERTGAGLLVEVLLFGALGGPTPVMTLGRNEDETRRTLTARFLSSPQVILIDNVTKLQSATLSAAITSRIWTDRLIGTSREVHIDVQCGWVATGVNPDLSREIAGRAVRTRLDAGVARPEERTDFRHPKLRQWAEAHRLDLVRTSLILCQAWVAEGCPEGSDTLGGFEAWVGVIGGILEVAGIRGFLEDREQLYLASDTETGAKRQFVQRWRTQFGGRSVGVGNLYPLVVSSRDPIDLDLRDGNERSQKIRLGKLLARARDTIVDGYQIVAAGDRQGAQQWKLVCVGSELRDVS